MTAPKINQPLNRVFNRAGFKASLIWNTIFKPKWQKKFTRAQMYVDSEVLRLCEPYTPFETGQLIKSGTLGTKIGSGEVKWIAPYSKAQYYMVRKNPSTTGALRYNYWFVRMKETHLDGILAGAKKIMGSEAE